MNLLLTGDSHLGGLRRAQLAARGDEAAAFRGAVIKPMGRGFLLRSQFFADRGDHAEIVEPEFRQRVERVPPAAGAFNWIGISGPMNTARVWRDPSWARYKPFGHGGGIPVSAALLKSVVEADVRRSIEFVQVVSRSSHVFVIEAPWPFRSHKAVSLNGADTVQFIHRWYRDHVMRELQRLGVPVLEIDHACVDAEGFMKPEFRSETATDRYHANARFGRIVLDRIVERFGPADAVASKRSSPALSGDGAA